MYIPMPTSANLLKLYLRMIPALPMQYEAYCLAFTRCDDFFQGDTEEAFLVLRRTLWIIPEAGEIPREGQQFPLLRVGEWVLATLLQCHELGFNLRLRGQRLVPAALQLPRAGEWFLAPFLKCHELGLNLRPRGKRLFPAGF